MKILPEKGQSILEYVVLIALLISSLLIMQVYIKRGYQGRLKQDVDELGQQYSPGHTTSVSQTNTTSTSTTCTGGKCWGKNIPDGMTVTKSNTQNTMTKTEGVDSFATEQ